MGLSAGKLRHRVVLQSPQTARDADGGVAIQWQDEATVWAAIEPLSAREFIAGNAMASNVDTRITIRHYPGVQPDWRVVQGSTLYNVRGVLPDKSSGIEYLTLPCSSGVNDGG